MEGPRTARDGNKAIDFLDDGLRDQPQLRQLHSAQGIWIDQEGRRMGGGELSSGAQTSGAEQVVSDQGGADGHHERVQEAGEVERQKLPRFRGGRGGAENGIGHQSL